MFIREREAMDITRLNESFAGVNTIRKTSHSSNNFDILFRKNLMQDVFEKSKVSFGKVAVYQKPVISKNLTDSLFDIFKRSEKPANTIRLTTPHTEALANLGLDYKGNITIKLSYQTIKEGHLRTFCVTLLPEPSERKEDGQTARYFVSSKQGIHHRVDIDHIHYPEKTINLSGSVVNAEQILKFLTDESFSDNIVHMNLQNDFMQLHLEREEAYRKNLDQLKKAKENKPERIIFDEIVRPYKTGAKTTDIHTQQLPHTISDLDQIVRFYDRLHHKNLKPYEVIESQPRVTFIPSGNGSSLVMAVKQKPQPEDKTNPEEALYQDNAPSSLTNLAAKERREHFKVITGDKTDNTESSEQPHLVSVNADNIDQIIEEKGSNPEARITDRERTLAGLHYKQKNTSVSIEDSDTLYQGKEYRAKKAREEYEKQQAEEYAINKKRYLNERKVLVQESKTTGNITELSDMKGIKDKRVINPDLPHDHDYKARVLLLHSEKA